MNIIYQKFLAVLCFAVPLRCLNFQIDEFYSKSFVPKNIIVSYGLNQIGLLDYNLTVNEHFPGKLLMHIFVRKLDDEPGGKHYRNIVKLKNVDFCKSLDTLRNITVDEYQTESIIPSTFVISCPLQPGFYYIKEQHFDENLLPVHIEEGRYLVQFELIQIYGEVIKLFNCKIKLSKIKDEESVQGATAAGRERNNSGSENQIESNVECSTELDAGNVHVNGSEAEENNIQIV